jgi:isopenicillin N synthase-like dioxygenase
LSNNSNFEIPVIDVKNLFSEKSSDIEKIANEFIDAYSTIGFSYITNHGIDDAIISDVFNASREFHALPINEKNKIALNELHRGYIAINTSTDVNSDLAEVKKPNQSESFMMMREAGPDDPDVKNGSYLTGPNRWPIKPSRFKERVTKYADKMTKLCDRLTLIIMNSLGVKELDYQNLFERPTIWLRLLYYPPQILPDNDLYGSAPHRDFGALTVLAQDQVGGLQVQSPDGDWLDVPELPNSFVVNVGNMLHRLTNGLLISTPHRVINKSSNERYSCPFFYDPNINAVIKPQGNRVSANNPENFEPIIYGDYLKHELTSTYNQHKPNT